uniref:CPG4 domain-containing protein n=1 Tax=Panagrellus redivivus TaxID=6233 RepID=A0A7E4VBR2_PANRE
MLLGSLILLAGISSVSSAAAPLALPSFNAFETGAIIASSSLKSDAVPPVPSTKCENQIAALMEQRLDDLGIDFRKNISAVIRNQRQLEKICSDYHSLKPNFADCPSPKTFVHKFGVVAFLETLCRVKYTAIQAHSECISDMTDRMYPSCHYACLSRDYAGGDSLYSATNSPMHCAISTCITRCVNQQIAECADDGPEELSSPENTEALAELYNELAGAQMLLGIEHWLGAGSPATDKLVQSVKMPIACRRVVWRAVMAAGNFAGRPVTQTVRKEKVLPFRT